MCFLSCAYRRYLLRMGWMLVMYYLPPISPWPEEHEVKLWLFADTVTWREGIHQRHQMQQLKKCIDGVMATMFFSTELCFSVENDPHLHGTLFFEPPISSSRPRCCRWIDAMQTDFFPRLLLLIAKNHVPPFGNVKQILLRICSWIVKT